MKRTVALVLTVLLVLQLSITSFASGLNDNIEPLKDTNLNKFEKFTISFDKVEMKSINNVSKAAIGNKNVDNITQAKEFVKNLNLESRGYSNLQNTLIKNLDNYSKDNAYLENYTVYLANSSTGEYFGTYDGIPMLVSYVVYDDAYTRIEDDKSIIEQFINGGIQIGLNYVTKFISVPVTIFGLDPNEDYHGKRLRIYNKEEVTERYISVKDVNNYYGSSSQYYTCFKDNARVAGLETTLEFSNPYFPNKTEAQPLEEIYSSTWFSSKESIMKKAYYVYLPGDGINVYTNEVYRGELDTY